MVYNVSGFPCSDELYHYGILGQKWGVRRYQNSDGTLTAEGKKHYSISDTLVSIKNTSKKRAEEKRQKEMLKKPWLMTDDELKNHLNRVNMEKQYLDAVKQVKQYDKSYRIRELVQNSLESGAQTLSRKAFEAAGNTIISKQRAKDDKAYNKMIAEQAAKNKLRIDDIITKGEKKATKNDISSQLYKEAKKNYKNMSASDIDLLDKKYKAFKNMEYRYNSNLNIPNGGGGKKKGG